MDEFIWVIILFIVLPLLERIFKKRQQEDSPDTPELPELEVEAGAPAPADRQPGPQTRGKSYKSDLERLIAEELGLDVPQPTRKPPIRKPPARKPPARVSSPYTRLPRSPSGEPRPQPTVVYPRSRVESRPPPPEPSYESLEVPPEESMDAQLINLDERGIAAAKKGERVKTREEAQPAVRLDVRRGRKPRRGPGLPDPPEWSSVKKAIVWSEILGPPKALRD